jgi:Zn-dependent peptidase ImmA (M78 family)
MTCESDHDRMEKEANQFAMALLMPEELVIRELQKLTPATKLPLTDTKIIAILADRFGVERNIMQARLQQLNLFQL